MRAIGIDFGTKKTRAAIVEHGDVSIVDVPGFGKELPSIISYAGRAPIFGTTATTRAVTHAESTVQDVKLLLGRARTHQAVAAYAARAAFSVEASGARVVFNVGSAMRPPEAVAASVLDYIASLAFERLRERPGRAAIAVPLWFGDDEKRALADAAARASIEGVELVNDTTALIASSLPAPLTPRKVAVVDVGAGGVSAAVFLVVGDEAQLLGAAGDAAGGDAADELAAAAVIPELAKLGPIAKDPATAEMLRRSLETMKRTLSAAERTSVPIEIDRARYEVLIAPMLSRMETCCRLALESARLPLGALDRVMLAGGMTAMPAVRDRISRAFGVAGAGTFVTAPMGAVALGAARIAAAKTGEVSPFAVREAPPRTAAQTAQTLSAAAPYEPQQHPSISGAGYAFAVPSPGSSSASLAATLSASLASALSRPPAPSTREQYLASIPVPPINLSATATDDLAQASPTTADLLFSPRGGRIQNPENARALLDLALTRRVTQRDLDPIALPVLLFTILSRHKRSGILELNSGDRQLSIPVHRGAAMLKKTEHTALLAAFKWPKGTYDFDSEAAAVDQTGRTKHSMIRLTIEGLRTLTRGFSEDELKDALTDKLDSAPVVPADLAGDLERMGLLTNELRLAKHTFDGKVSLRVLLGNNSSTRHTTLQLVATLVLFDYLDWHRVEAKKERTFADELMARADQIEDAANHFEALGIHWSATTSDVDLAYRKLVSTVLPGSAASRASPEACLRIRTRADEAYAVLKDEYTRLFYRRETFPDVDLSAVSDILSGTIDSLEMKGDTRGVDNAKVTMRELDRTVARAESQANTPLPQRTKKP